MYQHRQKIGVKLKFLVFKSVISALFLLKINKRDEEVKNKSFNLFIAWQAIDRMNILGKQQKPFLFIIDFDMRRSIVETLPLHDQSVLFDINGFTHAPEKKVWNKKVVFCKKPVSFQKYKAAFEQVMDHIRKGNSYLVNLTQPSVIDIDLSLKEIFYYSQAKYKLWLDDQFVVFSPETFVRIHAGVIKSYPMKGTIDATIPGAASVILNDPKEKAEHITIVDLIRNDLSIFAKNVRVTRLRYLDQVITDQGSLLQVSSEITGQLPAGYQERIGDLLFSLLPAGSVSGAPKPQTIEIIKSVENYERGYYTGVFGYFDGENMDSAVMIRFIEKKEDQLVYKSGGGITAQSQLETEYQELINKIYVPFNRNNKS